jgi:hypothetical protein
MNSDPSFCLKNEAHRPPLISLGWVVERRWREDPSHRLVIVGLGFSLNQRTGSRLIRQRFVNYERVKTFEFGKRIGLNQRTGSC